MPHRRLLGLLIAGVWIGWVAVGETASGAETQPDKSLYSIVSPTPDSALRDFAPDRPARSIGPTTVDAGRFQIESDFINHTFANQDGMTTRTTQALDPVLKLGVTSFMDFEVAFGGFNDLRTTDNASGAVVAKGRGFGDVTLTTKFNLTGNDGGKVAFALAPYLIVPGGTANITAGQVEGGVIAPLALKLPQDFGVTLQTEVDALANVNGPGTHVNFTNIVNVSRPVPGIKDLTSYAELYSSVTTEPHAPDIYTFDLALAYLVETNTQLDIGANIGLNRGAPDYQLYSGIAHRF
ncbi:transporter [Lichenifustis flavocetrariae]|uniref:Transporter n=1 Tax=Lichenifustis flavocetrariae TaxID=2949735 RepID=A0AA41YT37_9HYPH|nr:transporter [Lichenifustis flavocetrariae]MCW6508099.1 transporter [Lichenifustis flavocetrariae]